MTAVNARRNAAACHEVHTSLHGMHAAACHEVHTSLHGHGMHAASCSCIAACGRCIAACVRGMRSELHCQSAYNRKFLVQRMASKSNSLSSLSEHIASDQRTKQPAAHGNVKLLNLANGENGTNCEGKMLNFVKKPCLLGKSRTVYVYIG